MERLKLLELKEGYRIQHGKKPNNVELAAVVFDATDDISDSRKIGLLSRWNVGHDLSAMKPRHLIRLAEHFGITDIHALITL